MIQKIRVGTGDSYAKTTLLQPDGRIILAGWCYGDLGPQLCATRLNIDGSADSTFGNGLGQTSIDFGFPNVGSSGGAAALQSDQKAVIAGTCKTDLGSLTTRGCIARMRSDGSLDATFGDDVNLPGRVLLPTYYSKSIEAIAIQADGRIIVVGGCRKGAFCIGRLLSNGAIDVTFADAVYGDSSSIAFATFSSSVRAVAVQSDGKILAAGSCLVNPSSGPGSLSDYAFCIGRLTTTGTADTTFVGPNRLSAGAIVVNPTEYTDGARSIAVQSDGKILVSGACDSYSTCLLRLQTDGSFDLSLVGPSGSTAGRVGPFYSEGYVTNYFADALALQGNGKIILAGSCEYGRRDACVARLNANGTFDELFAGNAGNVNGVVHYDIGIGHGSFTSAQIDTSNRIVLAGTCTDQYSNSTFCAARVLSGADAGTVLTKRNIVEFRYTPLDYYFVTSRDSEINTLDLALGWQRTGQVFSALAQSESGSQPITRFYFDQVARNKSRGSHFYTLLPDEVATVQTLNPTNQPAPGKPVNEGIDSYAYLPNANGACASGQVPVYRLFRGNARFPDDPNHRFTIDLTIYNEFVALGWDGEGVKLCVPQ